MTPVRSVEPLPENFRGDYALVLTDLDTREHFDGQKVMELGMSYIDGGNDG